METFNFSFKGNGGKLDIIEKLVDQGQNLGLELGVVKAKIESIKKMTKDGMIRIVLLGSFSDGKTSAIAGLLGRLEDSMKIDNDESSDELTVYRPDGLRKGFEIVDTPGLFGSKQKEINGKMVKFSEITEKYISEAHIIIYVCDAVTPLKDSHVPIIKKVLRDFNKLDSTIFVINKMDEAGYDLTDDEDFQYGTNIKKEALIKRLRSTINLTPEEESRLHIICIAADPKGKGMGYWFKKANDYMSRSHIGLLRDEVKKVVDKSDVGILKHSAETSSVLDAMEQVADGISENKNAITKTLMRSQDSCNDLSNDLQDLKGQLVLSKNSLSKSVNLYKSTLITDIRGASLETFGEIVERELGIEDGKVTFNVVESYINSLLQNTSNNANSQIHSTAVKFDRALSDQEKWMQGVTKLGVMKLNRAKVTRDQVFTVRNLLFKNFKFKPWGAVNMAKRISKGLTYASVILGIGMDIYSLFKKYKATVDLENSKAEIIKALQKYGSITNRVGKQVPACLL